MAKKEWLAKGVDGLSFGDRLCDLIANKGITQAELAKSTGICQSRLSDYITGKEVDREKGTRIYAAPDCATVITLAKYFAVSTDYLLGIVPIPATDLATRDIHRKTGLSEENITRLMETEIHTSGLSYADFVNMCLDSTYLSRVNFMLLAQAKASQMEYEKAKADSGSSTPLSRDEFIGQLKAIAVAQTQAQDLGCKLMSHEDSIKFYAREIASDLERYLLEVFNSGID